MYEITVTEHPLYQVPVLDFRGTPAGIDATLVVRTGIVPVVNTGIAGREPGVGQVGAGLVTPPHVGVRRRGARARRPRRHTSGGDGMTQILAQLFKYRAPATRAELFDLLATHEAVRVLAGGTDLLVDIRNGTSHPELLVNLKHISGYADITWSTTPTASPSAPQ